MKKNIMMRLSAVLLVAVLLTTCVISGTWAKYTTSDTNTDSAQVAKWGVVVSAQNEGQIFAKTYNSNKVESSAEYKVVAPKTSGALTAFTITGSPEVAVDITYTATLELTNWAIDGDEYCPIIITVNNEKYYVGKTGIDDVADLITEVEEAIENQKASYEANATLNVPELSVSWEWEYEGSTVPAQNDTNDTALGDAAAEDNAATISLTVVCTVTQAE